MFPGFETHGNESCIASILLLHSRRKETSDLLLFTVAAQKISECLVSITSDCRVSWYIFGVRLRRATYLKTADGSSPSLSYTLVTVQSHRASTRDIYVKYPFILNSSSSGDIVLPTH